MHISWYILCILTRWNQVISSHIPLPCRERCHQYPSPHHVWVFSTVYKVPLGINHTDYNVLINIKSCLQDDHILRSCDSSPVRIQHIYMQNSVLVNPTPSLVIRDSFTISPNAGTPSYIVSECVMIRNDQRRLFVSYGLPWLNLGLRPANERRRYFVTTSLIGWVQA